MSYTIPSHGSCDQMFAKQLGIFFQVPCRLPNRATVVEMSPTSHIVTIPSFPFTITTTTTTILCGNTAIGRPGDCPHLGQPGERLSTPPYHHPQHCRPTTAHSAYEPATLLITAPNDPPKPATSPPTNTAQKHPEPATSPSNESQNRCHVITGWRWQRPKRQWQLVSRHSRRSQQEVTRGWRMKDWADARRWGRRQGEGEDGDNGDDDSLIVVPRHFCWVQGDRGPEDNDIPLSLFPGVLDDDQGAGNLPAASSTRASVKPTCWPLSNLSTQGFMPAAGVIKGGQRVTHTPSPFRFIYPFNRGDSFVVLRFYY